MYTLCNKSLQIVFPQGMVSGVYFYEYNYYFLLIEFIVKQLMILTGRLFQN